MAEEKTIELTHVENPIDLPIEVENPIDLPIEVENPIDLPIEVENPIDLPIEVEKTIELTHVENPIDLPIEEPPIVKIDQDTLQRITVGVQVLLEMYRVITSSLLILFVPQLCADHICTTTENLVWETNTYNTGLCFNFISMAFLVNMYYLELVRENTLIGYLAVNPELANDNEGVGKQLELLPVNKQNKLFSINKQYRNSFYGALSVYSLNMMLSAAAVNRYYAGSQTVSTFVTYVLFMATKFGSVYSIVSTDKFVFYSAYLSGKVQYNDVDEDKRIPENP
jgi:hypothetical protein